MALPGGAATVTAAGQNGIAGNGRAAKTLSEAGEGKLRMPEESFPVCRRQGRLPVNRFFERLGTG